MTSDDHGFEQKVTTHSRMPGWEAVFHRDDGSAIQAWGVTEDEALMNLRQVLSNDE